jgi:hypothetical protein
MARRGASVAVVVSNRNEAMKIDLRGANGKEDSQGGTNAWCEDG